jgi:predicted ATPase/class 3 adenylate cyclase
MRNADTAPPGSSRSAPLGSAPTAYVGRHGERAELRAALDDAMSGRGRLVLLAGEPGIGKTRLADELAAEATARGAAVAWGRCWEGGGAPAYWPWTQILRACARARAPDTLEQLAGPGAAHIAALVPELQPGSDSVAETRQPMAMTALGPGQPQRDRFRLFDAVAGFLRNVSSAAPLVIVFDDGHAADMASLLMLRFIARDLRQLPVLLVVTYREIEARLSADLAEVMAELGREGATLSLRGLSAADVGELIEANAGQPPDQATAQALHRATEGNPFFLTEIIRLLLAEGQVPQRGPSGLGSFLATFKIPDGVRVAIRRRVGLVSAASQRVLSVAAVVGREFDLAVIRTAIDLSPEQLAAAVDEAESCGIVTAVAEVAGRYRFSHALVAETLYRDLPASGRRQLHLEIARTIEERDPSGLDPHLPELAYHYSRALPAGPAEKAVEYARRGAQNAQALLAYEEAARLYQMAIDGLALRGPSDDTLRCDLLLGLGEALYGAGLFDRTRAAFERAAEAARSLGSAAQLARAALGFGMPPIAPYTVDRTLVRMLEEALAALAESDSPLRAMVLARLASELYWSESRSRGAELSRQAVEMARRIGDRLTLMYALFMRHLAAWSLDNLDERLAIATEIVELAEQPGERLWAIRVWGLRARYYRFVDLLELGETRAVDEEIERYATLAAELRQHLGYEELARATRALMSGRLDEAERMASAALEVAQRLERRARPFRQAVNSLLLVLRREQGRLDELEPIFAATRAGVPRSTLARCSLALCYAELGRRAEATGEFEQLAVADFATVPRDAGWMAVMVLLTEVCASLGDGPHAAVLYQLLLPYAARNATLDVHVCYGSVAYYLGLLAVTMGVVDRAEQHFDAALQFNLRMGASAWVARTRYHYAAMLLARAQPGDRERAAELAELALAAADAHGMSSLAGKLRELGRADASAAAAPDGTVTILFTDLQDSTGMTERLGDLRAQELLRVHNAIVREQVAAYKGFEVKSTGDGFMIAFPSARRALLCAIAIQRAFAAYNAAQPSDAWIWVSMGLHTGEAIWEAGDFYGKSVILAARLGTSARGGEILVSSTFKALTDSAGDLRFDEGRDVALKGFTGTHRVYAVLWREGPVADTPPP